jgi:hypothetical protein
MRKYKNVDIETWYKINENELDKLFNIFLNISYDNKIDMYDNDESFTKFIEIMYNQRGKKNDNKII